MTPAARRRNYGSNLAEYIFFRDHPPVSRAGNPHESPAERNARETGENELAERRRAVFARDDWRCTKCRRSGRYAKGEVKAVRLETVEREGVTVTLCRDCAGPA